MVKVGGKMIKNDVLTKLDQQITFNWEAEPIKRWGTIKAENFQFQVYYSSPLLPFPCQLSVDPIYPFCSWVWIHICSRRRWEYIYAAHRQASSQERHHTSGNQTHWTPRYLQPWLHSSSTCTLTSPPSLTTPPLFPPSLPPSSFLPSLPLFPSSLSLSLL